MTRNVAASVRQRLLNHARAVGKRFPAPYDIIDNRTRELAPEINNFLADSIRAHFAVGYFFPSGFQAIAEHIPHLDQLRFLMPQTS